ncbi:MAG TPA: lipocalin-like domain-containing protein, partial [Gammaproteobacteria bacterium]|nr:lipocalin-like domain-containing protein [Gammaproteobacteria bacterium]
MAARSPSRTPVFFAAGIVTLAFGVGAALEAQAAGVADRLVSSWTLVSVDKQAGSDTPVRARAPHGLLVLDRAGNVFEFFNATPARVQGAAIPTGALSTLEEYGGFWGRYTVDEPAGRMRFTAEAGVSPSVQGLAFSRSFELEGDRLVVTSTKEPQAQGDTRWTWQRFPTVENLSPAYRQVVGFWRNVGERQVNPATGEIERESQRGPSVIVYTPAGFVGVHFPPRVREPFAGETATAEEAQAALRGYIGYFGSLGVYPGEVSHNILSGVAPTSGSILRRYAKITGDELVVRLQSGAARTSDDDQPRV